MDSVPPHRVFLSYAHEDLPWVAEFRQSLKAEGIEDWFEADELAPGDEWQQEMSAAFRNSRTLVLILSPHSLDSAWLHFELGAAIGDHKRIIPVLTEDIEPAELPGFLKQLPILKAASPRAAGKRVAEEIEGVRGRS
jgi:hypothetical protein